MEFWLREWSLWTFSSSSLCWTTDGVSFFKWTCPGRKAEKLSYRTVWKRCAIGSLDVPGIKSCCTEIFPTLEIRATETVDVHLSEPSLSPYRLPVDRVQSVLGFSRHPEIDSPRGLSWHWINTSHYQFMISESYFSKFRLGPLLSLSLDPR